MVFITLETCEIMGNLYAPNRILRIRDLPKFLYMLVFAMIELPIEV